MSKSSGIMYRYIIIVLSLNKYLARKYLLEINCQYFLLKVGLAPQFFKTEYVNALSGLPL
jgi:hypothetical protein